MAQNNIFMNNTLENDMDCIINSIIHELNRLKTYFPNNVVTDREMHENLNALQLKITHAYNELKMKHYNNQLCAAAYSSDTLEKCQLIIKLLNTASKINDHLNKIQ